MNDCFGQHCWEVHSGDYMNCVECGAEGRVEVIWEPEEDE